MKRTISLLTVLTFILALSGSAFAQTNVSATATVLTNISVTNNNDVNFGNIQQTSSPVIDPNGTNSDVTSNAVMGKLTISASTSTQLIVDWNQATVTLADGAGNNITYTPKVTANSTDNASTSSVVSKNTASAATATDATSGNLYIYIGGNLGSLSNQTAGTYTSTNGSGDLQFTVNYQ
ncbi:MAG TPA: hypothetical protein VJ964_14510 [Balneolaceae bacterium]|nr:hypothetical protein [Balneolaceae bacterium]